MTTGFILVSKKLEGTHEDHPDERAVPQPVLQNISSPNGTILQFLSSLVYSLSDVDIQDDQAETQEGPVTCWNS
jgi:hypothetical protein